MANALIIVDVDAELAKARAKIDEFVKETESRRITLGVDAGPRRRTTLGGQVVEGPDAAMMPTSQAGPRGVDAQAELQRRWINSVPLSSLNGGGTGFGSPMRPVPTAGTNTVYGNLSPGVQMMPIGSGAPLRATVAAPANPFGGYQFTPQATGNGTMWNSMRTPFAVPGLNTFGGVPPVAPPPMFGPGTTFTPIPTPAATTSRLSSNRATRLMGFGGIGVENMTRAGAVGATALYGIDRFLTANQRQRDIEDFDTLSEATENAYTSARGTSNIQRRVGGWANAAIDAGDAIIGRVAGRGVQRFSQAARRFVTGGSDRFMDDAGVASARDTAMEQRASDLGAASERNVKDLEADNAMIGSDGLGRATASSREATRRRLRDIDLRSRENTFANYAEERSQIAAGGAAELRDIGAQIGQGIRTSLAAARATSLSGSNDPFAAGLAEIDAGAQSRRFSLERSVRGMSASQAAQSRNADDATYLAERGSFEQSYNRGVNISTFGIQASTAASQLARRGNRSEAEALSIRADTAATLAGLPGYEQYQQNPNMVGAADRRQINAVIAQGQERLAGAAQDQESQRISRGLSFQASEAALALRPLQSRILARDAEFASQYAGADINEPSVAAADAARRMANVIDRRDFNFQRGQTDIGLAAESQSFDRLLARDPIGASAAGIAGSGAQRIRALAMAGLAPEAELARANSLKQLDVLSQDYRYSFRGVETDLQNMSIFNVRDSADPGAVLGEIESGRKNIRDTEADAGGDIADGFKRAIGDGTLKAIIQDAIEGFVTKG